ncbi:MAG TPA: hypothetical protein VFQ85_16585 [Mycobacteriales bacterium]|nr:hypothetical protein [Mycobacteriales bacterium]
MAFLLPIPITLLLGLVWTAWASRPPRPADPVTSVEEWSRAIRRLAPAPRAADEADRRELARSA